MCVPGSILASYTDFLTEQSEGVEKATDCIREELVGEVQARAEMLNFVNVSYM